MSSKVAKEIAKRLLSIEGEDLSDSDLRLRRLAIMKSGAGGALPERRLGGRTLDPILWTIDRVLAEHLSPFDRSAE